MIIYVECPRYFQNKYEKTEMDELHDNWLEMIKEEQRRINADIARSSTDI